MNKSIPRQINIISNKEVPRMKAKVSRDFFQKIYAQELPIS